ncbi:MAG: RidA family protein [Rhodobacteraceae bacterium]|nr:MAG: RidA family protein [Paracoccaceae bacterium]
MSEIAARIARLGLVLPEPLKVPPGMVLPFPEVNIRGNRAIISGQGPLNPDGTLATPLGRVGEDVTVEDGYHLARLTGLAMLGGLQRSLGDLDRITGWVRIFGMVNSAPDFQRQPMVINGFSELILEIFGPEVGRHARSAVGMAALPMRIAVEIEGEVEFRV